MEDLKQLKVKNWKKTAKDRRTWRDLAEKGENPQKIVVPNDDDDDDDDKHLLVLFSYKSISAWS